MKKTAKDSFFVSGTITYNEDKSFKEGDIFLVKDLMKMNPQYKEKEVIVLQVKITIDSHKEVYLFELRYPLRFK